LTIPSTGGPAAGGSRSAETRITAGPAALRDFAIWLLLIGTTFGQRLCISSGASQVPFTALLAIAAIAMLVAVGQARVDTNALLLYALTIFSISLTLYFAKSGFSTFSFSYLVVLYSVFIFSVEVSRQEYLSCLDRYQNILLILSIIALLQLLDEFTSGTEFSVFDHLPDSVILQGYNTRPVLFYGSAFHKANADFFLEPSFLSQFMALGIIIEILFFGRLWRMALFGLAIFASFSGTGMLLLLVFAGLASFRARRIELLYALPALLVIFLIFHDNPYVTAITGRLGEFGDERSSAFMRFVAPNQALSEIIGDDFTAFLVGRGPGFVESVGILANYQANFPVIQKMLIEYGVAGLLPFSAFILYCFFARTRSVPLSLAVLFAYLFLSGSLLQPHTLYLFFVLVVLMPPEKGECGAVRYGAGPRREASGR
jgi:hypothetical protein